MGPILILQQRHKTVETIHAIMLIDMDIRPSQTSFIEADSKYATEPR